MSQTETSARIPIGLLVGDWLPPSETFIYDQVVQARRTTPFVCARRRTELGATRFPYENVCTLSTLPRLAFKATRRAPAFLDYWRDNGVRLVHAHFGLNGAHALELVDALDLPLIVSFHGHDVAGLEPQNRLKPRYFQYQLLRRRLFERGSLLLAASSDLAERLVADFGAPADKVVVHRLGVDVERFAPVARERPARTVLSVGRLVEKKGLLYGLRAFALAHAQQPELRYRIIGAGPLRGELAVEASRLGIQRVVEFLGARSPAEVWAEMNAADLFLCPSVTGRDGDRESGVLVVKEAAATGLPVVASRHGGLPEIIDDEATGFLVGERDVSGLAERLLSLIDDADLRGRLARAATAKMRREYDTRVQNKELETHLLGAR